MNPGFSLFRTAVAGLLLTLGGATTGAAQMLSSTRDIDVSRDILDAAATNMRNSPKYTKIMGSLKAVAGQGYFTTDWLPGAVASTTGKQKPYKALRYNLVLHALEVRDTSSVTGTATTLLPTADVAGFTLGTTRTGTHSFEAHYYQSSTESGNQDFFENLNAGGPVQFFLHHSIAQKPTPGAKSVSEVAAAAAYTREARLYVLRPKQKNLTEFTMGRKPVLKLFGDRAAEVEQYATSKGWSYENLEHVVWMADYYNKLAAPAK